MQTASLGRLNGSLLRAQHGLTLIELIITVAIVGILASVGWSYYDAQKLRGHRGDAMIALTTLAQMEERYMTENGSYADTIAKLNPPASVVTASDTTPKSGAYTLAISIPATAGCTVTVNGANHFYCYEITATTNGAQTKDTNCTKFLIDQTGKRTSEDDSGTTNTGKAAVCWSK